VGKWDHVEVSRVDIEDVPKSSAKAAPHDFRWNVVTTLANSTRDSGNREFGIGERQEHQSGSVPGRAQAAQKHHVTTTSERRLEREVAALIGETLV